jgi:membrane protein
MKKYIKRIFKHFMAIEGLTRAADLAYTTLLSIVPLVIVSLGLFSVFPIFKPYAHEFHNFIFKHFVPHSAHVVQEYIESFARHAGRLSIFSLVFIFFTSIILIFSMESTFNIIWKVKKRRHGLLAFLIYCVVLTVLPFCIVIIFGMSIFIFSLPYVSNIIQNIVDFTPVLYLIPVVILFILLCILYKTLPNCEVKLRSAAIGALVAAPLFEIIKISFGYYINYFSTFTLIYGAAAIIPIFLLWLYLLWLIIISGAVVAYVVQER